MVDVPSVDIDFFDPIRGSLLAVLGQSPRPCGGIWVQSLNISMLTNRFDPNALCHLGSLRQMC